MIVLMIGLPDFFQDEVNGMFDTLGANNNIYVFAPVLILCQSETCSISVDSYRFV